MAVEVVLFLSGLAAGRRPELHRVSGDLHVHQASRGGRHQDEAAQDDQQGVSDAERAPRAEDHAHGILKTLAKSFTTRRIDCKRDKCKQFLIYIQSKKSCLKESKEQREKNDKEVNLSKTLDNNFKAMVLHGHR